MNKQMIFYIIILTVLITSCSKNDNGIKKMCNIIQDSFYVEYNSYNGAKSVLFLDSFTCLNFNRIKNYFTIYKDSASYFKKLKTYHIPDSIQMWYTNFPYFKNNILKFLNKQGYLYTSILNDNIEIANKVKIESNSNAKLAANGYYPSTLGFKYKNSLVYFRIISRFGIGLEELKQYSSDKIFVKYNFNNVKIETLLTKDSFGKHPSKLLSSMNPFIQFTFNSKEGKVAWIYESFNSLYFYDLESGKQTEVNIDNKYFKPTLPRKANQFFDKISTKELYEYRSCNFRYTGIRYNKKTNHYLVTFTTPKSSVKDWLNTPMKGIVLDSNLKTLYYLEFEPSSDAVKRGDFVLYNDKVAIRTNNIKSNKLNYEKYYTLNF